MDTHIEWDTSEVEQGELSVSLEPAPDFAFMVEFDGVLVGHERPSDEGWGKVLLAEGKVVVSDVQPDSADELRAFLDEAVQKANRLAVDYRTRAREQEEAEAAAAAERQAAEAAAAKAAAERDEELRDEFRA
jgi:predicted RecB family endonuclease